MKKISNTISTLIATSFLVGHLGCRDECLEQNYDAALRIVQEFNQNRCQAVLSGGHHSDYHELHCPSGTLRGEVNSHVFELAMECGKVQIQMEGEAAALVCGQKLELMASAPHIRAEFESILAQLEVD